MSPFLIAVLIGLAVLFALLLLLFAQHRRDLLFMAQENHTVSGTVTEVRAIRTGKKPAERVTIRYAADGKEYTYICCVRPEKFHRDETVELILHPKKPRLAFPVSVFRPMPASAVRLMAVFLLLLLLLVLCFSLGNTYDALGRVLDCAEIPLYLLICWGTYLEEYRIIRRGKRCTGTIVYAERDPKTVRAVAAFSVGGETYETRMMSLPVKHCKREYNPGGQIGVLYREKDPSQSAVEDDTRKERTMRTAAMIVSIAGIIFWVLLVFVIGP